MKLIYFSPPKFEYHVAPPRGERGLKRLLGGAHTHQAPVAPPRGERGLKLRYYLQVRPLCGRSPSWGAWIETMFARVMPAPYSVAPPRGERGLKPRIGGAAAYGNQSLPLVGSVD